MIEDNTRPREDAAPKNQRLTAIRSGGIQHKTCSHHFCHGGQTGTPLSHRLEVERGMPCPPRRRSGEQKQPPRTHGTIAVSVAESRQLRRRARPLGFHRGAKIVREGETPSQVGPAIWDLPRDALPALARRWDAVAGDPRQHTPVPSGREAVDLPLAVVNRCPEAVCRVVVGVDDLFPHWAANRGKNGAKRGQLGAKTSPKVCQTAPRGDKNGLAGQVAYRVLAMESHAAETFVNKSFRSSPEGVRCCPAHIWRLCSGRPGGALSAHCLPLL